jgi:replicative DNA helicase
MSAIDPPLFGISQRQPPSNLQAEQALLGAILSNNKAFDRVATFLKPDHFYDPINGRIYEAIAARINTGRVADPVTLNAIFENSGVLEEAGGTPYLVQLLGAMVGIINAGDYGREIHDSWVRRQIIEAGENLVNRAFGSDPKFANGAAIIEKLSAEIDGIAGNSAGSRSPVRLHDAMDEAIAAGERAARGDPIGISTGFPSLDAGLIGMSPGGLEPGCLYILAARPAMGKSALGLQIAIHAAEQGIGVFFDSLEMQAAQLGRRALAHLSGIPALSLRQGRWTPHDADRIVSSRAYAAKMPLTISDEAAQSMAGIARHARAVKRKHALGLIVIDHLHIVATDPAAGTRGETWAVGKVSNDMKKLAKDMNVPVLALAQLNRGVEGREDKRPSMADLRQSGNIEQDADAIMFLYRPEYYLKSEPERGAGMSVAQHDEKVRTWRDACDRVAGKAEVIFAKARENEASTVTLEWDGSRTIFKEMANGG